MIINGREAPVAHRRSGLAARLPARTLGALRHEKGCNQGACGACTVLVDGNRIISCLALAVQYEDRAGTYDRGLGGDGGLHPLQQAFIDQEGFQWVPHAGSDLLRGRPDREVNRGIPSYVTPDLTALSSCWATTSCVNG